jgi:hypothetical protein
MGLKTLRMLDSGPNKNYQKGQLVTVDEVRAAILIEGDHAEEPGEEVKANGNDSRLQGRTSVRRRV